MSQPACLSINSLMATSRPNNNENDDDDIMGSLIDSCAINQLFNHIELGNTYTYTRAVLAGQCYWILESIKQTENFQAKYTVSFAFIWETEGFFHFGRYPLCSKWDGTWEWSSSFIFIIAQPTLFCICLCSFIFMGISVRRGTETLKTGEVEKSSKKDFLSKHWI